MKTPGTVPMTGTPSQVGLRSSLGSIWMLLAEKLKRCVVTPRFPADKDWKCKDKKKFCGCVECVYWCLLYAHYVDVLFSLNNAGQPELALEFIGPLVRPHWRVNDSSVTWLEVGRWLVQVDVFPKRLQTIL